MTYHPIMGITFLYIFDNEGFLIEEKVILFKKIKNYILSK